MNNLPTITKGALGEEYTAKHLKKSGFRVIEKNLRNKYSEIDIIAENKEYIIFVEVKSRSTESAFRPSYAVNKQKQRRIITAAYEYINTNNIKKQPRFDIAEVFLSKDTTKPYKINYIENAYTQGGDYAAF